MPDARFSQIHINIVGPFPPYDSSTYMLTMIERFTRWPEAIPIVNTQAKTICNAIFNQWISRFGCPLVITTDQGSHMRSALFAEFAKMLGTQKIHTTAYHPISNGIIERFHRQLKSSIKAYDSNRWTETLPVILLGIHTAVKEDIHAELVFGTTLRLPCDMVDKSFTQSGDENFVTQLRNTMRQLHPVATSAH